MSQGFIIKIAEVETEANTVRLGHTVPTARPSGIEISHRHEDNRNRCTVEYGQYRTTNILL